MSKSKRDGIRWTDQNPVSALFLPPVQRRRAANIVANVSRMFAVIEPCYVSASAAELGDSAGRITWSNALDIARDRAAWLLSSEADAVESMRDWGRSTGAWSDAEVAAWSDDECLALFAQNVASELRMLGSDDAELTECAARYESTDWESKSDYPIGAYYVAGSDVHVEYYTGI